MAGRTRGLVCGRTSDETLLLEPSRALHQIPSRERAGAGPASEGALQRGGERLPGHWVLIRDAQERRLPLSPGNTAPTQFLASRRYLGSSPRCLKACGGPGLSWDTPNSRRGGQWGHLSFGSKCGSTTDTAMPGRAVRLWGGLLVSPPARRAPVMHLPKGLLIKLWTNGKRALGRPRETQRSNRRVLSPSGSWSRFVRKGRKLVPLWDTPRHTSAGLGCPARFV